MRITYIGGPTALLQLDEFRLLTDPTFDPAGQVYRPGPYTLRKTAGPAISPEAIGHVDVVLLSHEHHFDNLDHAGRDFLTNVATVITTPVGAERLGNNAIGLASWQSLDLPATGDDVLRVSATPARHGPANNARGPVTGFVLTLTHAPECAIYVSGDTVWYEGVAEIGKRFSIKAAFLFMGAARVPEVGPWHLTLTAAEGVEIARAFAEAKIIPLHFEGWAHLSKSREDITHTFAEAALEHRLCWFHAGREVILEQDRAATANQSVKSVEHQVPEASG